MRILPLSPLFPYTPLFRSIGYLRTMSRVTAALRCFRNHLAPEGIVIVEPWFPPGVLRAGPGSTRRAELAGVRVERSSHTTVLDKDRKSTRLNSSHHIISYA